MYVEDQVYFKGLCHMLFTVKKRKSRLVSRLLQCRIQNHVSIYTTAKAHSMTKTATLQILCWGGVNSFLKPGSFWLQVTLIVVVSRSGIFHLVFLSVLASISLCFKSNRQITHAGLFLCVPGVANCFLSQYTTTTS